MAFQIKKRESYSWTVNHVVSRSEGEPNLMVFDAEFKALPQSKVRDISERLRKRAINDDQFIDEILSGWRGLANEAGETFDYSPANLKTLMELFPGLVGSITAAWFESVLGLGDSILGKAARKN